MRCIDAESEQQLSLLRTFSKMLHPKYVCKQLTGKTAPKLQYIAS